MRFAKLQFRESIFLAAISLFAVLMAVCGGQFKTESQAPIVQAHARTFLKTIPSSGNAIGLIGFELHEDPGNDDNGNGNGCIVYNAVVKTVDPANDDYKSMCRDIVADIVTSCGSNEVKVNIYDSFEAYRLAIAYEDGYRLLSAEEERYTNEHRVATYGHVVDYYDDYYSFAYYPDAANSHSEKEIYTSL